eukprot:GHVS01018082.1.p1 GENE.GHVS01018082.1~~GHVS01018082.1.p1  ORF type:complete len:239 (-),score=4.13 GHVS01018082.1:176-892(-)
MTANVTCAILLFCQPSKPSDLFHSFKGFLAEDFIHLQMRLIRASKTLSDFDLPTPTSNENFRSTLTPIHFSYLTPPLIEKKKSASIFVDAPGGTGKTFIFNLLLDLASYHDLSSMATASSGIASTLLTNGSTAHYAFKLPIPPTHGTACRFTPRDSTGRRLLHTHLIIWDEAPMMHKWNMESLDISLTIGDGTHDIYTSTNRPICIPELLLLPRTERNILGLIKFVYDTDTPWLTPSI